MFGVTSSVIGAETRKSLGEYYTPDWLAEITVAQTVRTPLTSKVLDPACGSGTFLFYAVRSYIAAGTAAGMSVSEILDGVTRHVFGMDLHPVAVTLARVTYVLALGRDRLTDPDRRTIQIPVYLGDSLQWQEQKADLWTAGNLVIQIDDQHELFGSELSFPDALLDNAAQFDQLVNEMASRASHRKLGSTVPSLKTIFTKLAVPEKYQVLVEKTFKTMCRLHDEGRDHIWGYYVRNLTRPLWLSREGNQADILVGNPPWLAYRHMTPSMQASFRAMSEARGLWAGAKIATHQDLSALFVVRACELYLRQGGKFGMVLPNAAIDREHYAGFRSGDFGGKAGVVAIAFDPSWDLRRIRPHFFPRAASVVFGTRVQYAGHLNDTTQSVASKKMPNETQLWTGKLKSTNASWTEASKSLKRTMGKIQNIGLLVKSPYDSLFTQGATFTPRFVFVVEKQKATSLGLPKGRESVTSSRSVQEKMPWKNMPSIVGTVESEFIRPIYNGDNVYPYRIGEPFFAVIPCSSKGLLDQGSIDAHPGLQQWWSQATELWDANRSSERMALLERVNYQGTLAKQIPAPELRIVYNRSGMHVVCAKVTGRRALIANGLYWAPVNTVAEADYLCAMLNAPVTTDLVRPFMSYGKDERDIHKHVWELPVPIYDSSNATHRRLAVLGAIAETLVKSFKIDPELHFAATRRHIRELLEATPEGKELDELAFELIG